MGWMWWGASGWGKGGENEKMRTMAQRPTRQKKDDRILHKSATANEIRTANYAYSMEPTKELILDPMVGSPTIPETKR